MLAVTGATGGIGGRVAARLAERGAARRLVARDPARAPELGGAEVASAEYRDGAALEGLDTLFLVSAGHPPRSLADVLREHPESYAHLKG
jgi:uncharacterized protein YbjT (DUF2867 family)